MKIITVFCLTALVSVAHVNAQAQSNVLKSSGFNAHPNTEFGFGPQTVQIGFRGFPDYQNAIRVNLYKLDDQGSVDGDAVQTFIIAEDEKGTQKVITLAVPSAEVPATEAANTKKYAVKFCKSDNTDCSDLSASGKIDFGLDKKLDCKEVDQTLQDIDAEPLMGYADSPMLGHISTNEESTMKIQGYAEGKYRQQKQVGSNWMLYFVFKMSLKPYATMLAHPGRNYYCSRKYTPSILTFIIDETTKRVERAFKFTPVLSREGAIAMAAKDSFPVEVEHTVGTDKLTGNKIIWHTLCFTAKDLAVGAVKCTKPYREMNNDGSSDLTWDISKDTINANGNVGEL